MPVRNTKHQNSFILLSAESFPHHRLPFPQRKEANISALFFYTLLPPLAHHKIPASELKSTEEIIEEYLEYVLTEHTRGTPHSNAVVMAPLKMLYGGRRGREYRRRLAATILPKTKPLPDIVRDVRLMLQEMDFNSSASEAEVESDNEDGESSKVVSGCV